VIYPDRSVSLSADECCGHRGLLVMLGFKWSILSGSHQGFFTLFSPQVKPIVLIRKTEGAENLYVVLVYNPLAMWSLNISSNNTNEATSYPCFFNSPSLLQFGISTDALRSGVCDYIDRKTIRHRNHIVNDTGSDDTFDVLAQCRVLAYSLNRWRHRCFFGKRNKFNPKMRMGVLKP